MIVGDQNPLLHRRVPDPRLRGALVRLALLVVALVMTLPHAPSYAAERDTLILTGPAGIEMLGRHLEYTTDPAWQMKVGDFVEPSKVEMQPLPGPAPDFGYTPAKIWLRLKVVNEAGAADAWRFFVHANFTQQIAIYRIAPDGNVTTLLDLTEDSPFSSRPIDSPQMVAPFNLAAGEAATLVMSYYSQGSSRLTMSIETADSFAETTGINAAKSYAFYGMMLVMIVLALAALAVLRQPVFIVYAGYLLSVLTYVGHADGAAFQYVWPNFPRFNSMASVVAGSGVMVFACLFAVTFLQTARHHRIMHRVLLGVVASVLAIDVVLWVVDPQLLKRLLVVMISISVLSCLTAGLIAARKRFREVRFYVFAWLAGLIPAILFTARYGFGFEPTFITTYDAIRLALIFDALMMGLAIFDRYNHLRQTAMEETLAHAQHNLTLGQRLAALEERYAQATTVARQREEGVKDTVHDLRQPMHALRLSLRQMFSAGAENTTDARQTEAALAYMEKLVAERLADHPETDASEGPPADGVYAAAKANGRLGGSIVVEPGLHEVMRGVADMFASEAAEKGLGLRLILAAPDGKVAAYPLMRVLSNLVSNAIKYTRQGRILIGLRRHGSGYRVEVHDTGPGLSGAAFEQALLRNERLERDLAAAEGTGLGLAVVKETAEANDWRVTSDPRRRTGASMRIDLPGTSTGNHSDEAHGGEEFSELQAPAAP